MLQYDAGAEALLPFSVDGSLSFARTGITLSAPSRFSVESAWAHTEVDAGGNLEVILEWADTPSIHDQTGNHGLLEVTIPFNEAGVRASFAAGQTLDVDCELLWETRGTSRMWGSYGAGQCTVSADGAEYVVEIEQAEIRDESNEAGAVVSGNVTFSPVPGQPTVYDTPCTGDYGCFSLAEGEINPSTGWCLPDSNLKSDAPSCDSECDEPLTVDSGSSTICLCGYACGQLGSGGVTPVCDPAYGCIDI